MFKSILLSLLFLGASAVPLEVEHPNTSPVDNTKRSEYSKINKRGLPGNDPWYAAPDGFENVKPGTILKHRDTPKPLSMDDKTMLKPRKAIQVQYRSTNSVGDPIANVMTVIVPYNANPMHHLAYAMFSDAVSPDCSPSFALQTDLREDAMFTKSQIAPMLAALAQGWIVTIADDGGPEASFPAGLTMAYTTFDSIRAVKSDFFLTGVSSWATTTVNGYSGGGITAAWTGEMHNIYAPDVQIAGIALGGLIPNFVQLGGQSNATISCLYMHDNADLLPHRLDTE